jgi:DNA-binding transcriptional ArsR family regulator
MDRQIKDAKVLAAMAHPLRRRLLDVLKVEGPSTVSALAEHTGQAVGNVSHHLRVLAESKLVEEVPELARDRRERWWRRTAARLRWSASDFADDPVADAALSLNLDRAMGIARASYADREVYGDEWYQASFTSDTWLKLTPEEGVQLAAEMGALFRKWSDRDIPDDSHPRESVYLFAFGTPARP